MKWAAVLAVLGSAAFAADRGMSAYLAAGRTEQFEGRLREAAALVSRHPEAFAKGAKKNVREVSLKTLLQETAAKEGLQVAFLSEGEKEAGKGRKERQVSARLLRSPQEALVRFLGALETHGMGARVKELHLRPSKETTAVYEDAELVLAQVIPAPEAKR